MATDELAWREFRDLNESWDPTIVDQVEPDANGVRWLGHFGDSAMSDIGHIYPPALEPQIRESCAS
ncbi:MAG: hypothetical protein WC054_06180 [Candidatus Nanopelagicales bacterium]